MTNFPNWANLALIIKHGSDGALVECFTVTEDSCELSGAWKFENLDNDDFRSIISNRLLLTPNSDLKLLLNTELMNSVYIDLDDLIFEASSEATSAVSVLEQFLKNNEKQYSEYMKISPSDRKLISKVNKLKLEPFYFNNWDFRINHSSPASNLNELKKRSVILGTPTELLLLNQYSWLIKTIVEMWLQDEKERYARKKINPKFEEFRVLPVSWLESFKKIKEGY